MLGRIDAEHVSNPDYVHIIGSNRHTKELQQINEDVNKKYT